MFRQYETVELSYSVPAPEGSFVTVNLSAEFRLQGSDEPAVQVKGFYAGDQTYKVRFLPLKTGRWVYRVEGVVQEEGVFEVMPADGRHGLVRAEGTHLRFDDGTWFNSFGTTVYALAHQEAALTEETFASLASAPFNKVRMCVFPKHYHYNHNDPEYFAFRVLPGRVYSYEDAVSGPNGTDDGEPPVWDVHHPDFRFWDRFEALIHRLGDMGIQADLILFHPYDRWGFSRLSHADDLVYLDYLTRRFAAFPNIWWSLANEYDLIRTKTPTDWHDFEETIVRGDPYHHMLSNHNCFPLYDFSREAVTHCSCQLRTMNMVPELQARFRKPVLYDECVYEGNLMESWGCLSAREMVNRFWKVHVTGGYCTHGEVLLDPAEENIEDAVLWWAKGGKLKGQSPQRIAFLRRLMEEIDQPLEPVMTGLGQLLLIPKEQLQAMASEAPQSMRAFLRAILSMEPLELQRHLDAEFEFAGATEDKSTYLYYLGTDCRARTKVDLPTDRHYRIEVIDAWNMTKETVQEGASGSTIVRLPGREYMAVLARQENSAER